MALCEMTYRATNGFPRHELFGITSQMRRAAVSVSSNIAEGHCRRTTGAYVNHISIALGSHGELATLIRLSAKLGYLSSNESRTLDDQNELIGRLLYGLHRSLSARLARGRE